jgi:GT2 family glycosyltransferase
VSSESQVICFLDDDIVLDKNYFKNLINTYNLNPDALGVGGYISNEAQWKPIENEFKIKKSDFYYDGFIRRDGSRFILRKKLGLDSNVAPGFSPKFSHGRSVGFLPPSGKIYQVEQLMGGASSFPKSIFKTIKFSEYFQGYGLYEDADFSLRLSKKGKLYINTKATLNHYHHESGRPNKYAYGKMVVRNGWYVWRVKNPTPDFNARLKWNFITLILIAIRFTNIFTTKKTLESFTETIGRTVGWLSLFINRPKLERE